MTNPAIAIDTTAPLLAILDRHFEPKRLDRTLGLSGSPVPWHLWGSSLYEPLRDLLARPGKELRARLVEAGWELGGGHGAIPTEIPLVVELLHAGSLVVDDIEDGSAERRSRPALHVLHGVPIALNAANLLYFLPLQLIDESSLSPDRKLCVHQRYTSALVRCHHGQALDLCGRLGDLAQREVRDAVEAATRLKTGSLTELAIVLGAVAAGTSPERERSLAHFGREIGIGLQMLDDLGGITSQRRRAKGHEDLRGGRLTWTWAWLAESLDEASWRELRELADRVENHGTHPEALAQAMRPLLGARPKRAIHARLRGALDALRDELGPSRAVRALESEIELLESSYE